MAAEHPKASEDVLLRAIEDEEWGVRRAAVENPNATEAVLQKGVEDKDFGVRRVAVEKLGVVT